MYETKIAKGIKWMEKFDRSWFNKIDLSKLCMFSNSGCVLSQFLCGDPLEITSSEFNISHGFMVDKFVDKKCQEEWLILKKEWTDVILQKRREIKIEVSPSVESGGKS